MKRREFLIGTIAAAAGSAVGVRTARAAGFPDKPVTMVVGFGPGGMTDVTSRLMGQKIEKHLGVNVVVENKPGAGGTLAVASVGQLPADGYTMVSFLTEGPFTSTYQNKPIKLEDWTIIGGYMPQERVLFASKTAPFNTVQEMIAYAKKTPITFADGGSFWAARVVEAFAKKHDLKIRLVPFRSGAEGSAAILGGHVTTAETGTGTSAWKAAKKGDLKILATLTSGGLAPFGMPDVPTWDKLDADFIVRVFYGYAVRAGTPADRVKKLRDAFKRAVEDPEIQQRLKELDLTPQWTEPQTYESALRTIAADAVKLREYLK